MAKITRSVPSNMPKGGRPVWIGYSNGFGSAKIPRTKPPSPRLVPAKKGNV